MIRLTFFAPYPEIVDTIHEVFAARPDRDEFQYEVIQDFFDNPLTDVDADVAIARGFTAHTMQQKGIICAELKVTGYDVIAAVDKCRRITSGRKIAMVGAFNMVYGSEAAENIFPDVHISIYPIVDEKKLEENIEKAIADGCDVIVGGYTTVQFAGRHGIPAVMIETGGESVNNAIAEAKVNAIIAQREKEKRNEVANVMNYSFQGILSADRDGVITFANTNCYSLLSYIKHSLPGHQLQEIFPELPVTEVIREGKKILSELIIQKGQSFLINCVPIEGGYDNAGCVLTFQNVQQVQAEEGKLRKKLHQSGFKTRYSFSDILHQSPIMKSVIADAVNFSYADSNILIYGETGTGKELFAQSIHNNSSRRNNPFVAINCAALPENLLESELFGYVEGAFTGAAKGGKMGYFEIAHKGTIFLDEIGDVSPKLQSRLLRVLQEKEIIRIGNDTVIPVDVRVIAATNRNLKEAVKDGEFRQDLLYRLDVLELNLPPLRKRDRDIPFILNHFIQFEHERTGCNTRALSADTLDLLSAYPWPGNIREMHNFCERLCILCTKEIAESDDVYRALPDLSDHAAGPDMTADTPHAISNDEISDVPVYDEKKEILNALYLYKNNRSKAAEYLGMHPSTLWRKMKKYHLV